MPAGLEGTFINLDRAVERRAAIQRQLDELALPYEIKRLAAIDGSQRAGCPPKLRPAQYGCWLSHLKAIEDSLGSEAHLHVMEDDALLGPRLRELPAFADIVEAGSNGDWDILYLDATLVELPDMQVMFEWTQLAREKNTVHLRPVPAEFSVFGAHSYVINGRRKRYVLEFLQNYLDAGNAIDGILAYGIQHGDLQAHITAPFVTSSLDLGLTGSSIARGSDDAFLAWFLFRRLCFGDLSDKILAALEPELETLARGTGRAESLLGALMAYRMARWPGVRFRPVVEP
jgi:Glycosyltransferase family 25 (LPS biosynthesis protein)